MNNWNRHFLFKRTAIVYLSSISWAHARRNSAQCCPKIPFACLFGLSWLSVSRHWILRLLSQKINCSEIVGTSDSPQCKISHYIRNSTWKPTRYLVGEAKESVWAHEKKKVFKNQSIERAFWLQPWRTPESQTVITIREDLHQVWLGPGELL